MFLDRIYYYHSYKHMVLDLNGTYSASFFSYSSIGYEHINNYHEVPVDIIKRLVYIVYIGGLL